MAKEPLRPEEIKAEIEAQLGNMVEVLMPGDCDEPILEESVRHAVFEWMLEARSAKELKAVGLAPRTSCLLSGPPGCGKTTLAHHFAARLGLPLAVIQTESMVSMYIGQSGQHIAQVFRCLRKYSGQVVGFLDELDSIASVRSGEARGGAAKEQNAIVTALLTNIESLKGLFFAATNLAGSIDPAIWRRFSMQIEVALPGFDERYAILKRYGEPFEFSEDLLDELALATKGAAPSLLRQLMEGVKRALVLGPKLKRPVDNAFDVLAQIVSQVQPHPVYMAPPNVAPPLWTSIPESFRTLPWPPARSDRPSKEHKLAHAGDGND